MDPSHFVLVLLFSSCLQVPFSEAFSPQPFVYASATFAPRGLPAASNDEDSNASSTKERKPWDVLRFVRQSSKFVTPPSLPMFGGGTKGAKRKVGPGETLWTPASPQNSFNFAPLDDVVMGGASSSTIDNNTGTWTGTVTDANNGGFVGLRSTPLPGGSSLDMRGCRGVELRLRKGAGQRFKFVLRDSAEFNGICWTTEFDAGKTGIRIPFEKQTPTLFGNTDASGRAFNDGNVSGFQLVYSKFKYDGQFNEKFQLGQFALQILELRSY